MYLNGEIELVKTKLISLYRRYSAIKQLQSMYLPFVKLSGDAAVKAWRGGVAW